MPEILQTDVLDDGWARLLRLRVRLDTGDELTRQLEAHRPAVAVLPYDPERRTALLVRLFRIGPFYAAGEPVSVEAPAGLIDQGEAAEAAARREALEETGVRLSTLEPVGQVWSAPGVTTDRISLFLAPYVARDRIGPGGGVEAEHENITVLEPALAELEADLRAGRIADLKTLALVQALKLRRPELFA